MNKIQIYNRLTDYCLDNSCSTCKINAMNPKHSCGHGYSYSLDGNPVELSEALKNYRIVFGGGLREIVEKILFKKVKNQPNYKFLLNGTEELTKEIRINSMRTEANSATNYWLATLEIDNVNIIANVFIYNLYEILPPIVTYSIYTETKNDWQLITHLKEEAIDWKINNWAEQLETNMFKVLNEYLHNGIRR